MATVTVPKSQIDEYERRIKNLETENNDLFSSKLKLIMKTAEEIERLRQYISSLNVTIEKLKVDNNNDKNNIVDDDDHKALTMDVADITPDEPITICQHCGNSINVNNNYYISISGPGNSVNVDDDIDDNKSVTADPNKSPRSNYNDDVKLSYIDNIYDNDNDIENEEEKQDKLSSDDDDTVDDDDDDDTTTDSDFDTPGRISVIVRTRGSTIPQGHTRGNSIYSMNKLKMKNEGSNDGNGGEHSDIPHSNIIDDNFVICDNCTSNLSLQFVRKYPDAMQCLKCCSFYEYIFLCNECGKCVCSECYEYEAKMQSIDRITSNFTDDEHKYSALANEGPQQLMLYQKRITDITANILYSIIITTYNAADNDDYDPGDIHGYISENFELKFCYSIIMFCDDVDLCQMSTNDSSNAAKLFHIYWILSPQKTRFDKKFGFTDFSLLHSLKWNDNNLDNGWCIKQVIDNDIMIQNYLSKNYLQMNWMDFIREISKYINSSNSTNYSKLLNLLNVVINRDNINYCEVLNYNQYAWRELGGPPHVCSRGLYAIWNLKILQRSYCFSIDNKILDKVI